MAALTLALFGAAEARADGAPVGSATTEQKSRAQALFTDASAKAGRNEHSDALAGFEASFEVVASPNAKLMIARQLVALERWVKAYEAFDAAIELSAASGDPKYEATVKQAREAKAELAPKVAILRVDLGGRTATVTIGGKQLSASAIANGVAVEPGAVTIVFESEGTRTSQSTNAIAGKETSVAFEPNAASGASTAGPAVAGPIPPTEPTTTSDGSGAAVPLMATGGVLLGIGGAGIIVFAAFGVTTLKTSSDLEKSCVGGVCDPELRNQVEDAKTEQLVANIGAGVGFGAAALGLALLIPGIVLDGGDDTTEGASLHVGPAGASLQLRF